MLVQDHDCGDECFKLTGLGKWLKENVTPEDFVVCKMDVEGMEWKLIPHLKEMGVLTLIDELFFECHDPQPKKCQELLDSLNREGVWSHEWF